MEPEDEAREKVPEGNPNIVNFAQECIKNGTKFEYHSECGGICGIDGEFKITGFGEVVPDEETIVVEYDGEDITVRKEEQDVLEEVIINKVGNINIGIHPSSWMVLFYDKEGERAGRLHKVNL